jgi:hypothetical protein
LAYSRYYPSIYLEGLKKIMGNLRIASVAVDIRTEHHPNTSLQRYRSAVPLDIVLPEAVRTKSGLLNMDI